MSYSYKRKKSFLQSFSNTKAIGIVVLLIGAIVVPVTLFLANQQTQTQSNATAATTLAFSNANISANVGDQISTDVVMNPGSNMVSFVNLVIGYDSSVVTPAANGIVANAQVLPQTLDGPTNTCNGTQCTLSIYLSIGNDPTRAITTQSTIATVNFVAAGPTNGPSQITFDSVTQVLSIAPSDAPSENVLSTTTPAQLTIGGSGSFTPSPTSAVSNTPIPTTPIDTPTPCPNCTNTPTPGNATPTPTINPVCRKIKEDADEREKKEDRRERNERLREKMEDLREHKKIGQKPTQVPGGKARGACVGSFDPNNPNSLVNCDTSQASGSWLDSIALFFKNFFGGAFAKQ